ncbi:MAG: hypothetical protein AABX96_02915 [Nanoarchaeota archaeon]
MITISRTVEKIIEENSFIQEALSRGIINYAALAESIKPRIENEMKKQVKTSAIMMSLRRLTEKLERVFVKKPKFEKEADVFVKSDLFEITIKKSKKTFELIKQIYEIMDSHQDFMTTTQGPTQLTIIANKRNKKKILEILEKEHPFEEIDNLASIGTTIPTNAINEVGYFYIITRAFVWENIPIIELVSTLNELNLIIKENDVPKAFVILKETIRKNS